VTDSLLESARAALLPPDAITVERRCLSCGAPIRSEYCPACGQQAVDPHASTWHVVKEAISDATDVDGRAVRTIRALVVPGRLTAEFLRGRRAPYLGPFKLFLLAGTALTTTWIVTRGVDAHYYGYRADAGSANYIDVVVRGSLTAGLAIAIASWASDLGRRRLIDDAVFSLHLVATLMLWTTAITWVGTGWKATWGTAAATPSSIAPLPFLLFLPSGIVALGYIALAVHRVYAGRWWSTALRTLLITAVGMTAVYEVLLHGLRRG